jgi:hypothetical protein
MDAIGLKCIELDYNGWNWIKMDGTRLKWMELD